MVSPEVLSSISRKIEPTAFSNPDIIGLEVKDTTNFRVTIEVILISKRNYDRNLMRRTVKIIDESIKESDPSLARYVWISYRWSEKAKKAPVTFG